MAANNKPTQKPSWIPDNTTNITDPGSKATAGWTDEAAPSSGFNWFWNRVSQWINYADSLDYFENNYTIAVTDDATLTAAIAEIAALPKNLNSYTLTLTVATGSYTLSGTLAFSGFYNGSIVLTGTGSPVLTRASGLALDAENCDIFTATGIEFEGDHIDYSNQFYKINSVSCTDCAFTNNSGVSNSKALQAKNIGSCYLDGCTYDGFTYAAEAVFSNINVVGTTTITSGVFVGAQGGKIIYEAAAAAAITSNIGDGVTGGEFLGKYNYITVLNYNLQFGTQTESLIDIQPGKSLSVYDAALPGGVLQAVIKVVNVVGSRIYFYSTSGETTPDAGWVVLRDSSGAIADLGTLWTAYAGEGYTTIRESI